VAPHARPTKKVVTMEERHLLQLWNEKRSQIISAQVAPALVLIGVMVLAAQGTFADASDAARYLAIAVAGVTGFLAMISQYAAIREAEALIQDLGKITNASALSKKIASSREFLSLTAIAVVLLGLVMFALVIWSVLG
jgi:aldehyde:ferredoxin oxidoreductase